jgi:hypothetical protein
MLNRLDVVQVCDAREAQSGLKSWQHILLQLSTLNFQPSFGILYVRFWYDHFFFYGTKKIMENTYKIGC